MKIKNKIIKYKNKVLYEESLNRELMLIERIKELEIKIGNKKNIQSFISII